MLALAGHSAGPRRAVLVLGVLMAFGLPALLQLLRL